MTASVDKQLHVSPFLDEDYRYDLRLRGTDEEIELQLDVVRRRRQPPGGHDGDVGRTAAGHTGEPGREPASEPAADPSGVRRYPRPGAPALAQARTVRGTSDQTGGNAVNADIHAERLLAHANSTRRISLTERWTGGVAARAMDHLLRRIHHERLDVAERIPGQPARDRSYGPGGELTASVVVVDQRAYSAVLTEGSIGFGRGFIEGWWTSDDPVAVVCVVIRNLGGLDRLRNHWEALTGGLTDRLRTLRPRDSRDRNRDDIGAHYDIGNDFFELFLDETMSYSSAVFPTPDTALADASRHKYDLLLDRLDVGPGDHLLEIGTGWGGMAVRAAQRGCEVTTTTISSEQLREAEKRVANAGFADRVTVLDSDWRDLSGRYDRVVSIEMIEAVDWRDYDDYFGTIERCLAPGGRAAIQAIVLPDDRWERAKKTEDFIQRFVFPNGYLPSVAAIDASLQRATGLRIAEVEDYGPHYAETLRQWRERFDDRVDDIAELGLDDRFQRLWRFYLAYCEAGFRERHCSVAQILIETNR